MSSTISPPLGTFQDDPTWERLEQAAEHLRQYEERNPIPFIVGETDEQRWARRWRIRQGMEKIAR